MAYKRNPMRSERICSLSRLLMGLPSMCADTAAQQWLERSLDDSAIRRGVLPEAFLCADALLDVSIDVVTGMVVWPRVIGERVREELPFMATENVLMEAVKKGGDRQELHEVVRVESMEAAKGMKAEGKENDLIARLKGSAVMGRYLSGEQIDACVVSRDFVGRAPEQVREYVRDVIDPLLEEKRDVLEAETSHAVSV